MAVLTDQIRLGFAAVAAQLKITRSDVATRVVGAGVAKITVGTTAPASPTVGDLWVDAT